MEDIDWPIEPAREDPPAIDLWEQEPIIDGTEEIANTPREPDLYIKMFHNRNLWDEMTCLFCNHCLSVGPFSYNPVNLGSACGRCIRNPASKAHEIMLVRDHLFEKLMPHLQFECSHGKCDAKLFSHQVEDHEENCTFKSEITLNRHELNSLHKNDPDHYALTLPNVRELRDKLSCDLCTRPLSVFPVISNGELFICGRCRKPELGDWTEQSIYLMMAEYVKFPCANQGCTELLRKEEVKEHEMVCRWAHTECPLCGASQKYHEMPCHIRRNHWNDYKDQLEVKVQNSLMKVEGDPYLVLVRAVENHLCCAVYVVDEDKAPVKLRLEIVEDDSVTESWFMCVAEIRPYLINHFVRIKHAGGKAFIRLSKPESAEGVPLDEQAREDLECKICLGYMTGLIFICENKHALCANCKPRVKSCPMCRGLLGNDRNVELENKAANFKFPCQFEEATQCRVALIPKHLVKHEAVCRSRGAQPSVSCNLNLKCSIKLHSLEYNDYFDHCAKHHPDLVIYPGSTEVIGWSTGATWVVQRKVLFFNGESFTLEHTLCDEASRVTFSVEQLVRTSTRYEFAVEMNGNGLTTQKSQMCGVGSLRPEISIDIVKHISDKRTTHNFNFVSYRLTLQKLTDCVYSDDLDNDNDNSDYQDASNSNSDEEYTLP